MSRVYCVVSASTHDGDSSAGTAGTTVRAEINNAISSNISSYFQLDTTVIPASATITAATYYWFDHSYSKSARITDSRIIKIGTVTIYSDSTNQTSSVWKSHALTAGEYSNINTSTFTQFNHEVADPASTNFRTWLQRAWDYGTGSGVVDNNDRYSAYLIVDYEISIAQTRVSVINTII